MLVKYLSEEARKDDVGIGAQQIMFHQTGMLGEELFTTTTVISKYHTFAQLLPNSYSHYRR